MKNLLIVAISLIGWTAQAELLVVTMPLTGTSRHLSKFDPAVTLTAGGLLVRTTDGANQCLLSSSVLKANNSSGIEFSKYLSTLSSSADQYLLSCYTESGAVTQAVITKSTK